MSASSTTVVQLNYKLANGDLLNLYADNVAEMEEILDAVLEASIVQKYHDLSNILRAAQAVAAPANPNPAPAMLSAVPAAAVPADSNAKLCKHGEPAKWVPPGVSKRTGKQYSGFYACPRPKDQQCDMNN